MMRFSVVMPVLNEASCIEGALTRLRGLPVEIIVADGGSTDDTPARAGRLSDRVVAAPRGRALQMNAGATMAKGDVLIFLHADTIMPDDALALMESALEGGASWGRFDVRIEGTHPMLPLVAATMNLRSRLTGIATGDQVIFCRRALFDQLGGFAAIALMEDIDFSRRARSVSRPACLKARVTTSGRRWERHGVMRTILLMWQLRLRFFLGADPRDLARAYRPHHE